MRLRLVIAPEREPLYAAIDARFDRMIEQGALDEVRALLGLELDPGLAGHARRMACASWRPISRAPLSREEAVIKAKTETRRYAKRQMTWLRRFMTDWEWFPDAAAAVEAVSRYTVTCVPISTTRSVGSWK